ncbi:lasso RiPP family leader peptide-containing protein [Streptomyces sp. NPDC001739]|uniref:Lasso RiPP family leader peptide-containing protein n=1 Tax=Streptomyces siderophoricus TaxID=2802281 RepID=A0ABS1MVH0_9ACTN|nr:MULTISPECIES: lasso RiPP family leader peptide-containing protein [unclassified Streptomyces]MBL1091721.1 lasso RiPP family leader peptide-containing protein [Streptomyces sp. 9-7]
MEEQNELSTVEPYAAPMLIEVGEFNEDTLGFIGWGKDIFGHYGG